MRRLSQGIDQEINQAREGRGEHRGVLIRIGAGAVPRSYYKVYGQMGQRVTA